MKIKSIAMLVAVLISSNYSYADSPATKNDISRIEAKIDETSKLTKTLIEETTKNITFKINSLHELLSDAGIRIVKDDSTGELIGVISTK